MTKFTSLLVANRGEIALRIMKSARKAGLRTIAVYSDADRDAPHVQFADDAVCLGAAPATESYLVADKILEAARETGAGAIHPGYGFLSENADFARAVQAAGLTFVGPTPDAIDVMGDKARAKRLMIRAGVPCVPGYEGEDQAEAQFVSAAAAIGYPVMVKAAAGGGGKGMRLVDDPADLPAALTMARSEAENAFGSGELILEKAVIEPRHVEIQIFADTHSNVIHLGERDCSVQRRHQKVIEEAPSPAVDDDLRARMGAAAIEAAKAVDYVGAGTVEFLLDSDGAFYFLEMNTRLQVEHPVTEMVTGVDLVAAQLRVAQGGALGLDQADATPRGHAIEVRLYAEDPCESFLPSAGPVHLWHPPQGESIRVDSGLATTGEVSAYYDPMVAKIIAWGATREEARLRLIRALEQTALFGPASNRDFLLNALQQPEFADGQATTGLIGRLYGDSVTRQTPHTSDFAVAAVLQHIARREEALAATPGIAPELFEWSSARGRESVVIYALEDDELPCRVRSNGDDYEVQVGQDQLHRVLVRDLNAPQVRVSVDGRGREGLFHMQGKRQLFLSLGAHSFKVTDIAGEPRAAEEGGLGLVTAPMHGRLMTLFVAEGDIVQKGQRLAVLEAMKMQHEILAAVDGTVTRIDAAKDMQMAAGDCILDITQSEA